MKSNQRKNIPPLPKGHQFYQMQALQYHTSPMLVSLRLFLPLSNTKMYLSNNDWKSNDWNIEKISQYLWLYKTFRICFENLILKFKIKMWNIKMWNIKWQGSNHFQTWTSVAQNSSINIRTSYVVMKCMLLCPFWKKGPLTSHLVQ